MVQVLPEGEVEVQEEVEDLDWALEENASVRAAGQLFPTQEANPAIR